MSKSDRIKYFLRFEDLTAGNRIKPNPRYSMKCKMVEKGATTSGISLAGIEEK